LKAPNTKIFNHSIYFEPSKCTGEMSCMRVCPVEAIRVRNKKARMLEDKCIDCGVCVKACNSNAIVALTNSFTDFSKFKYTIAIPSLSLYSQFERGVEPKTILTALKMIGFDEVVDMTNACVEVFTATKKYMKDNPGRKPLISTFCPTCMRLIQFKYPELLQNIIPVIPPMELAARETKKEYAARFGVDKSEIGVIYITPCPSKMMLIYRKSGSFYSDFDGAIAISDIYNTLYSAVNQVKKNKTDGIEHFEINGFGLNFGYVGGLTSLLEGDNYITVSGINDVLYILEEIERGKLNDIEVIELRSCIEGCVGGSLIIENIYLAANKMKYLIKRFGERKLPIGKRENFNNQDMYYNNIYEPLPSPPIDTDLKNAITKIAERKEIYSKLPQTNCGACGSPTCLSFAEDIVKGEAKINECIYMFNEELKHKLKEKTLEVLDLQTKLNEK
jgi:Na+-translocating ferredoxin:NAD+ oxidoreductase RNF subunit RnfB